MYGDDHRALYTRAHTAFSQDFSLVPGKRGAGLTPRANIPAMGKRGAPGRKHTIVWKAGTGRTRAPIVQNRSRGQLLLHRLTVDR